MKKKIVLLLLLIVPLLSWAQYDLKLGLLKYDGGGDWYANPTALPNLAEFCNETLHTQIDPDYGTVEVGSAELFDYPFLHMTGHGNVLFSDGQAEQLRLYLLSGGFLHIDDNYGMDRFVRPAMKKVFPYLDFVQLRPDHPIFNQQFNFPKGLPKVHEHDGQAPQAFALYHEGRMLCFYTYESDLGDGWEDPSVHNDPPEVHLAALRMGGNIIQFVFTENNAKP